MAEKLEIDFENDTFSLVSYAVIKTGKASDIVKSLAVAEEIETPPLPANTVLYRKKKDAEVFVIYERPSICLLGFSTNVRYTNEQPRVVFFPKIPVGMPARVTLVPFVKGKCMFSYTSFAFCDADTVDQVSLKIPVRNPWLPNTRTTIGDFCMGTGTNALTNDPKLVTHSAAVSATLSYMNGSVFNNHIIDYQRWTDESLLKDFPKEELGVYAGMPEWTRIITCQDSEREPHALHLINLNRLTEHKKKTIGEAETAMYMHQLSKQAISKRCTLDELLTWTFGRVAPK